VFSVDRNKYQIHIPLPPKIDPTVTMMQVTVNYMSELSMHVHVVVMFTWTLTLSCLCIFIVY